MRNYNAVPGYLSFSNAVHLWASIPRPEETATMPPFQELAAQICQELRAGRLHAYLLVQKRVLSTYEWSNAPGPDDGKLFQVAERYWATPNANAAISGRWVEAPVLVPVLRDVKQEQNRGGFVMLEETSVRALIAEKRADQQPTQKNSIRQQKDAERNLRNLMESYKNGEGELPVKKCWVADVQRTTGVSQRGAGRAWDDVRRDNPELGSSKGKRKTKR
jgi:hypothetical protein